MMSAPANPGTKEAVFNHKLAAETKGCAPTESSMSEIIQLSAEVPSELGGQRLDQVAAQLFDEYSRSRLTAWIKDGRLTVDGAVLRPRDTVHGGAVLALEAEQEAQGEWEAEDIALDIVYEDDQILVINKPAGLVVHPAAGHGMAPSA